jgi:hypothetical protein
VDREGASLRRLIATARQPPYGPAIVVAVVAVLLGGLFVTSYTIALARPQPHNVPTALVGSVRPTGDRQLVLALERAAGTDFAFRPEPTEAAARAAIQQQRVYAALVLTSPRPRLLVASAAGASVARVFEQAAQQVQEVRGRPLDVSDAAPLPKRDPNGLVVFYTTLGATILGFLTTFQLRANAAGLPLRAWFGFKLGIALGAGLVLTLVTGPLLDALGGAFAERGALLSLESLAASFFAATMTVLIGRWALVPTWLLFVVIGNTSSGGAVAPPLLPPALEFIGRWLSPGATVEALRTAVYFPHHQHLQPWLVLIAWVLLGLAALVVAMRVKRQTPSGVTLEG